MMDTIEHFDGGKMPGEDFAHVHEDVITHILHMLEVTISGVF